MKTITNDRYTRMFMIGDKVIRYVKLHKAWQELGEFGWMQRSRIYIQQLLQN